MPHNFTSRRINPFIEPTAFETNWNHMQTGLGWLFLCTALFSFLYCISPLARAESLKFASILPERNIKLQFAKKEEPKTDRQKMLASACQKIAPNDPKCYCINNAVFKHDSSWATSGVGKKTNNPGNMRVPRLWKPSVSFTVYHSPGNGVFSKFKTLEDGITANVELYSRLYKDLSPGTLVDVWADGGGNAHYRGAVKSCFPTA